MTMPLRTKSVLLLALSMLAVTASGSAAPSEKPSECLRAWFDVRYGNAGYDHVVRLSSSCGSPVTCQVSSDIVPETVSIEVAAGATKEVVILRGSPAKKFTPHAECQFPAAVTKGDD